MNEWEVAIRTVSYFVGMVIVFVVVFIIVDEHINGGK